MTGSLADYQHLIQSNPHTGTPVQVVSVSLAIANAHTDLDRDSFARLRDWARESQKINEKVFSKLKVIGKSLKAIEPGAFEEIKRKLPQSYSTLHMLCSLKADELIRAVKSGAISTKMSVRAAKGYVTQIRFAGLTTPSQKLNRDLDQLEIVYGIFQSKNQILVPGVSKGFLQEIEALCKRYELEVRLIENQSTTHLKQQSRIKKETFWRGVLENEFTAQWFQSKSDEYKKQFNLKTIDELINTPLRSFTGFLVKTEGSRNAFWQHHGKAYIAKLRLEQEKTDDRVQRHNLRRRLEEVLAKHEELAIWRNIREKEVGIGSFFE